MTSCVLDASALIAFLFREAGAEAAVWHIPGGLISTVNYSEVVARALEKRMALETINYELGRLPMAVVPFDAPLATLAATLKAPTRALGLSLADRACLALGLDRKLPVVTGDRDWAKASLAVTVVPFR